MLNFASVPLGRPLSIGIVEGDPKLGASLQRMFESNPAARCVGVWSSAKEGLMQIDVLRPQMVLLNTNLPGMPVDRATALIRRFLPETQVIIISENGDTSKIADALHAGACGYLVVPNSHSGTRSAPSAAEELFHSVASVARGVVEVLENHRPTPVCTALTDRETTVARLITEGLTNKEIADRMSIQPSTVHSYTKSIFAKLHVRSRTEVAVRYVEMARQGAA